MAVTMTMTKNKIQNWSLIVKLLNQTDLLNKITINYKFILNFAAYTTPFVFGVVTDANDGDPTPTDKQNRGFNLLYSQLPCATLG